MIRKLHTLALLTGLYCAGAALAPAVASERPFVLGGHALQEDDDERVWEASTRLEGRGGFKALDVELEYAFEPNLSVEFGWARRLGDEARESELEVGVRRVWRDPARHGLGVAFSLEVEVEAERETEPGERGGWRYGATTLSMPLSWQWERAGLWTHLTLGAQHERDEGTRPLAVLGLQQPITRQLEAFGEWGAVREREGVLHAGVRWWLKREKLALDLSVLRRRDGAERPESLLLGLSVFDLSF
ncbi:hypothetical protein [Caldimonas tepidiphila]|uniref:hypothetical protein n=1 Tax=Caldimonas tepidiphila TaxID=2315841 RepID=UPI000E5A51B8|nr:hypothetical protein [Caldimonas tepidiphila]